MTGAAVEPVRLRLFELEGSWEIVTRADGVVRGLADRHYPRRRTAGAPTVGPPGRVLVLRGLDDRSGWLSHWPDFTLDGLDVYRCSLFRNEGDVLSSDLILEAVNLTERKWGPPPADGWATYIDTERIAGPNPGYCFKRAGWTLDRDYRPNSRTPSLLRLRLS